MGFGMEMWKVLVDLAFAKAKEKKTINLHPMNSKTASSKYNSPAVPTKHKQYPTAKSYIRWYITTLPYYSNIDLDFKVI